MKKYQVKGLAVEEFSSIAEFTDYVNNTPTNKAWCRNAYVREDNDYKFHKTHTWDEANELLRKGYDKGLKNLISGEGKITCKETTTRARYELGFVGSVPHIGNALKGLPVAMMRKVQKPIQAKTLTIYYDCSAGKSIRAAELERGGKNIYTTIEYLEKNGYRVRLMIFKGTKSNCTLGERRVCALINAKDYRQNINPRLLSYPITHPSFFRRHLLRWIEVAECTDDKAFANGSYGYTLRYKENIEPYLRERGILKQNDCYLDVETSAECGTIEEVLRAMGFKVA